MRSLISAAKFSEFFLIASTLARVKAASNPIFESLQALVASTRAALVATDSVGLQKDAYFNEVPCVTMRGETEWMKTITHGWNRLWSEPAFQERRAITEYGGGQSAEKITDIIVRGLA